MKMKKTGAIFGKTIYDRVFKVKVAIVNTIHININQMYISDKPRLYNVHCTGYSFITQLYKLIKPSCKTALGFITDKPAHN